MAKSKKSASASKNVKGDINVVEALSDFLGSTYTLYHKTLFYHWNVTGSHFFSLHKLFEEHYRELQNAGDEIAERVRALGYKAPGTMAAFIKSSSVKEDTDLPASDRDMIDNLLQAHEICAKEAHQVAGLAADAEDIVTNDLMVRRINFHDKAAWMLRSLEL